MAYCILRTEKLKTLGNVSASLGHTFRDLATHNADPAKRAHNEHMDQRSAVEVRAAISAKLPAGRRRDAVLCIEYLISASAEFFQGGETGAAYFDAAREWLSARHGAENLIFWAIHRDETSPHLVAYAVPILEGKLNAKHWLGGKAKLRAMQTDFARKVGRRFGLRRGIEGSKSTHTTVQQFYAAINGPAPALPVIEIPTPPLLGREAWAKAEGKRISDAIRPVLEDAARSARWGRLQLKKLREALATAQHQAENAEAMELEARRFEAENKLIRGALAEWATTYEAGLTHDQAALVADLADRLREENRIAARVAEAETGRHMRVDGPRQIGGPTPGK